MKELQSMNILECSGGSDFGPFWPHIRLGEYIRQGEQFWAEKEINIMEYATAKSTVDMLHKIETIEKEIMDLKLTVLKELTPTGKKVISLKGILKGVEISEQDITTAKQSLYCFNSKISQTTHNHKRQNPSKTGLC